MYQLAFFIFVTFGGGIPVMMGGPAAPAASES
jgi:hypothetical protein